MLSVLLIFLVSVVCTTPPAMLIFLSWSLIKFLSIYLTRMHAVYNSKHCTLRLCGDIKSRYQAAMENVITFRWYWYLIKRPTNSAGIRASWINCVLYKVLLNSHFFPVLNIYFTEPYFGPVQRSYVYLYWQSHGPLIPIKIIVQFFECKIPERVLLNGAISICSTGDPRSVIVPQYDSSKITVFVWGKNIILKFLGNTK